MKNFFIKGILIIPLVIIIFISSEKTVTAQTAAETFEYSTMRNSLNEYKASKNPNPKTLSELQNNVDFYEQKYGKPSDEALGKYSDTVSKNNAILAKQQQTEIEISCSWRAPTTWPACWSAKISTFVLKISSNILYQSAKAFDWSINYSLNMAKILLDMPIVAIGWKILLNVTNLAYIFILLFVAICIILGVSKYGDKALIARIIITAVLVNFSLFATKVAIDFTNIAALQFYNLMNPANASGDAPAGIAEQFMKPLGLTKIFENTSGNIGNGGGLKGDNQNSISGLSGEDTNILSGNTDKQVIYWKITLISLLGSLFVITTAFVFLAGALLFVSRTLVLLFLMLFSSLAFAANVLPATQSHFKDWTSKLAKNALFAPIFVGLLYILITALKQNPSLGSNIHFAQMILNGQWTSGLITFFMIQGSLVGILLISSKSGVAGGKWVADMTEKRFGAQAMLGYGKSIGMGAGKMAWNGTKNTSKFVGTRVGGMALNRLANSEGTKNLVSRLPSWLGRNAIAKQLGKIDETTGYDKVTGKRQKIDQAAFDYLNKTDDESREGKEAAQARALSALNMTKNKDGKVVDTEGLSATASRFLGGKGAKDARKAISKKIKKEEKDKSRLDIDMLDSATGLQNILGVNNLLKNDEPNDEEIKKLASSLSRDEIKYDYNGTIESIGGVKLPDNGTLHDLRKNMVSAEKAQDFDRMKDLKNDYNAKVSLVRTKIKAYIDADRRKSDKEDAEAEKKASKQKDKEPKNKHI